MRSAPARPRTRGPTRGRGRSTQRSPTSKRAPVRSTPERSRPDRSTSVHTMQARLPHRSAALAADALRPSTRRPSRGARSRRSRAAWERVGPACVEGARSGLARPPCCGELRAITAWWPASPRGSAPQRRAHRSAPRRRPTRPRTWFQQVRRGSTAHIFLARGRPAYPRFSSGSRGVPMLATDDHALAAVEHVHAYERAECA
jgi:hypothetical protein